MNIKKLLTLILTFVITISCMSNMALAGGIVEEYEVSVGNTTSFTVVGTLSEEENIGSCKNFASSDETYLTIVSAVQTGTNEITVTVKGIKETDSVEVTYEKYYSSQWNEASETVEVIPNYTSLDTSTNNSKDIDQNYTLIQTDETYTDVIKVKLEWKISDIAATYTSHKTWDTEKLEWVEAKEDINVTCEKAEFTLTNYSSKDIMANASFQVEDDLKETFDKATFENNDCVVQTPVVKDEETEYEDKDFTDLKETITATLSFKTSGFESLTATESKTKYGTYTIKIEEYNGPKYLVFSSETSFTLGTVCAGWINSDSSYIQSSTDGTTWSKWDGSTVINSGSDNKIYLRGKGLTTMACSPENGKITNFSITASKLVYCEGNIMALLDYENPGSVEMTNCAFMNLFSGCTMLASAPNLPAKKLATYCYDGMFYGCTSLIATPELSATELTDHCYSWMFSGCSSLTEVTKLPADKMASYCYCAMFENCTSLIQAPKLKATELANSCYDMMFSGCINLENAPDLPATNLASDCYGGMFAGCTSLSKAPKISVITLDNGSCINMFKGCTNLNVVECEADDPDKFITIPDIIPIDAEMSAVNLMFENTPNASTVATPSAGKSYKIAK